VVLARKLAIGLFDFIGRGRRFDAKNLVIVFELHA